MCAGMASPLDIFDSRTCAPGAQPQQQKSLNEPATCIFYDSSTPIHRSPPPASLEAYEFDIDIARGGRGEERLPKLLVRVSYDLEGRERGEEKRSAWALKKPKIAGCLVAW